MAMEMTGWRRYAVVCGGMVAAGAACSLAVTMAVSPRGALGPTVLQAQSPLLALLVTVVCFGAATAVALLVGRLVNAAVGLFVLGAGLAVHAVRGGTVEDLAFADGSLGLVALETLLWAGLVLVATVSVFRVAGPVPDFGTGGQGGPLGRFDLKSAAAGVLVIPVVWLIARSELRGQTLAAATIGGMVVGLLARTLSAEAQPRLVFATPCIFGAVGHLVGMAMVEGPLAEAFVAGTLPAISLAMPVDYASGSLMGVSMGLGWARSFRQQPEEAGAPTEGAG